VVLLPDCHYGVRVAVSDMDVWFAHDKALLGTMVAFTWSN
jgi:hypothetical protein